MKNNLGISKGDNQNKARPTNKLNSRPSTKKDHLSPSYLSSRTSQEFMPCSDSICPYLKTMGKRCTKNNYSKNLPLPKCQYFKKWKKCPKLDKNPTLTKWKKENLH